MKKGNSDLKRLLLGSWRIMLFRGIVIAILGIYIFLRPDWAVILIVHLMGLFFLMDGIIVIIGSVTGPKGRPFLFLGGASLVIAAIAIFESYLVSAFLTGKNVVYAAAFITFVSGMVKLVRAVRLWKYDKNARLVIIYGAILIILSFVLSSTCILDLSPAETSWRILAIR